VLDRESTVDPGFWILQSAGARAVLEGVVFACLELSIVVFFFGRIERMLMSGRCVILWYIVLVAHRPIKDTCMHLDRLHGWLPV
jgi:hypothetical protein